MREVRSSCAPEVMSLETLSVLQLCANNEPLLPNLKGLYLWEIRGPFVPFILFFLSRRITSISLGFESDLPKVIAASVVSTIPTSCPDLQVISLGILPRDPIITAAVSRMILATNRTTLRKFHVGSPLTKEASEVVLKLRNLRNLTMVTEEESSLCPASLPNLTRLKVMCYNEDDWPRLFRGATFGQLESVKFFPQSEEIGDFLGAFEKAALSSSVQNTLSKFHVSADCLWNPTYPSLLPFTQLANLYIGFFCDDECSSTVDDDVVISLSRAMPRLNTLQLGHLPCREPTIGVTAKGLMALALHCPNLSSLCIHFQVDGLISPPASPGMTPDAEPTTSWTDCALTELSVGDIPVPEESVLMITLALLRIFPRINNIYSFDDEGWDEVQDAIRISKRVVDCSSKHFSHYTLE